MCQFCQQNYWDNRRAKAKSKQNAGIIGVYLSKICLNSYNSYAYNETQQYRMVKGRVAPPKSLFQVATQAKKFDIL